MTNTTTPYRRYAGPVIDVAAIRRRMSMIGLLLVSLVLILVHLNEDANNIATMTTMMTRMMIPIPAGAAVVEAFEMNAVGRHQHHHHQRQVHQHMHRTDEIATATSSSVCTTSTRNGFLRNCCNIVAAAAAATTDFGFPQTGHAAATKSYSENAANFERINNGDFSGGAVFNNNPTTERGKKRRAMVGCKISASREEASNTILKRDGSNVLSEKECNMMIMDGDTEFMLQALRNLDCPTCANGIGPMQ